MKPLKMNPVFKSYIWGGTKLKEKYDKISDLETIAESWEISTHPNGKSKVWGGEFDGKTIDELAKTMGSTLLGDKIDAADKFPLLIKLIDARDNLSVQVHPDDNYAFSNENGELGKNEMWYILEAEEGAGIVCGFKKNIDRDIFKCAIEDKSVMEYLNFIPCKKGDYFYIPAGTIHAIGKGLLIAEIQQNSDTTYRVYDYNRKDKDGNFRELHTEKALDVLSYQKYPGSGVDMKDEGVIVDCEYFVTEKLNVKFSKKYEVSKDRFEILILTEGKAEVNGISVKEGETLFIPAYIGEIEIVGDGVFLRSYVKLAD